MYSNMPPYIDESYRHRCTTSTSTSLLVARSLIAPPLDLARVDAHRHRKNAPQSKGCHLKFSDAIFNHVWSPCADREPDARELPRIPAELQEAIIAGAPPCRSSARAILTRFHIEVLLHVTIVQAGSSLSQFLEWQCWHKGCPDEEYGIDRFSRNLRYF
jgi:hypothetical protein